MSDVTKAQILVGYDGSDEARRALRFAARALRVDAAVIAHVFPDPVVAPVTGPVGAVPAPMTAAARDELQRHARDVAEEGAELARAQGLEATIAVRPGHGAADVAHVLLDLAESCDAELIVVGHHHASRLQSALLGSVSISAVHDERRPVLVVPA